MTAGLRFERVTQPDLELLRDLGVFDREAFGETGLRSFDIGVLCRLGAVYVAREGGDVLGSCQLVRTVDEPDMLWIFGIYVRPAWRGRGYGTRLLELVKAEFPTLGAGGSALDGRLPTTTPPWRCTGEPGSSRSSSSSTSTARASTGGRCATGVWVWAKVRRRRGGACRWGGPRWLSNPVWGTSPVFTRGSSPWSGDRTSASRRWSTCWSASKVSITSEKPQTTRHRIAGVLNGAGFQMVLLDMPGFQRPRDQLTRRMQDVVDAALTEVDVVLFLCNGEERVGRGDAFIAAAVKRAATPVVVAINKSDVLIDRAAGRAGGGGAGSGRPTRAVADQCQDRVGCRRTARPSARAPARGAGVLPGRRRHRPARRDADRRTDPREGHPR